MATIRERLVYAIDVVTDGARRSIGGFQTSIREADGTINKFKAGASSAMQTISANAGTLALAGGSALTAFGAKAVAAAQETALGAGKLADATGLTVEAASALREVAADLGLSGETVAGVVTKMNKAIGSGNPLLEKYGIELQRTETGAADVNATLLDTIRRIGDIQNPTERAAAAQAAFGRSYAEAAELIFSNADELKRKLDDVSDAKIITPEELERARKFRDTMENLKDVSEDLTVAAGQGLIPKLTAIATGFLAVKSGADQAADAIKSIPGADGGGGSLDFLDIAQGAFDPIKQYENLTTAVGDLKDEFGGGGGGSLGDVADRGADGIARVAEASAEAATETEAAADAVADLGDKAANSGPKIGDLAGALEDARQNLADLNEEARDEALNRLAEAAQAVGDAIEEAFDGVRDSLDLQDLLDDITDQFGEVAEAAKDATDPEGLRNYNRSVRDLQRQLLTLLDSIKGIPPDKKVQIATEIQRGGVDELYRILGDLTRGVMIPVSFSQPSTPSFSGVNFDFNPSGGTLAPIINNAIPSAPIDQRTINIYNPVGSTPTTVYQDQQIDFRRNGPR